MQQKRISLLAIRLRLAIMLSVFSAIPLNAGYRGDITTVALTAAIQ